MDVFVTAVLRGTSKRPAIDRALELALAPDALDVRKRSAGLEQAQDLIVREGPIGFLRDRADDEVVAPPVQLVQLQALLASKLVGIGQRVGDMDRMAEPLEPPDPGGTAAASQ